MNNPNQNCAKKKLPLSTLALPISITKNIFMFGIDVYIFTGLVYLVARLIFGEYSAIVLLGNILLQWVLLVGSVLFFIVLMLRAWIRSIFLGMFTLLFVMLYGNLFLPNNLQTIAASSSIPLRVMTYNLAVDLTQPNELRPLLDKQKPDIVALVELGDHNTQMLKNELLVEYPYQIYSMSGVEGKALLSKHPILTSTLFTLKTTRQNIEAQIQIEQHLITVFVVHPPSPDFHNRMNFYLPDENHLPEIEGLLSRVSPTSPTLLMGDFNMTDQSIPYQMVKKAGFSDAFHESGFGFGATFRLDAIALPKHHYIRLWQDPALARIDFIWHSTAFRSYRTWILTDTLSDHSPLLTDLLLNPDADF